MNDLQKARLHLLTARAAAMSEALSIDPSRATEGRFRVHECFQPAFEYLAELESEYVPQFEKTRGK